MPPTRKNTRTGTNPGRTQKPAHPNPSSQSIEGAAPAEISVGNRTCARCAEELGALGLPYRIVLRCTHHED